MPGVESVRVSLANGKSVAIGPDPPHLPNDRLSHGD